LLVTEMAQEPPEPFRPTSVPVRDDAHALTDSGAAGCGGELLRRRQRVAPRIAYREIREVGVDVEERGARDVPGEVELPSARRVPEPHRPADKLIPHAPPTAARRSRRTTSRQTPPTSPSRSRTPTSRKPHDRWSRIDASFSGKTPAFSVQ